VDGLHKWDTYRDRKIELVAAYIRVVKRQNLVKQVVTFEILAAAMKKLQAHFQRRQR